MARLLIVAGHWPLVIRGLPQASVPSMRPRWIIRAESHQLCDCLVILTVQKLEPQQY